ARHLRGAARSRRAAAGESLADWPLPRGPRSRPGLPGWRPGAPERPRLRRRQEPPSGLAESPTFHRIMWWNVSPLNESLPRRGFEDWGSSEGLGLFDPPLLPHTGRRAGRVADTAPDCRDALIR